MVAAGPDESRPTRFRLTDEDFAALAAGRPGPATVDDLRRSQISRHLLLLAENLKNPAFTIPTWYAQPAVTRRDALADPMLALHTAATLAALRAGAALPPDPIASPRRMTATHDGLTLRVRLEDTDPLRPRLGLTPSRQLTDAEAARWQHLLSAAWQILVTRHRETATVLAAVLRVIVPIEPDPGAAGLSATSAEAFGAVALSAPADATSFAVGLIHETQHSLLNATRTLFDLVRPGVPRTYSPWREDPRPPFGLLHGAYAYQSVTRFWRAEAGPLARFEFARWRAAVADAADALLANGALTAAGVRFAEAMRDEVSAWRDEPVDAGVNRLALGANVEHRVRWRLRNLVVRTDGFLDDWRAGRAPRIPAPALRPGGGRALERSTRLTAAHRLLRDGTTEGLTLADTAYLRGDAGAALTAYAKGLESGTRPTEPDQPPGPRESELWAGIALVSPWRCVRERPETVRAAFASIEDVPLAAVAEWVEGSLMSPPV
ncbi:aKG-HExxH-type peptide beta-hydroxylase [Actinoplanes sp. NPDC051513]|uniref:aKG-HExxH-type peptide beta-hydroxylase n=1 Tax=Actinoplanes sp. NPDC051513 TaxID=3363908 RepID=UPI0037B78561